MNRWRAGVLGLGLAGPAVADDIGWRPVTTPPPAALPAGLAAAPLFPLPAAGPVTVPVPPPSDAVWQPVRQPVVGAGLVAPQVEEIRPAAGDELPVPRPMPLAKPPEPAPVPRPAEIPRIDVPAAEVPPKPNGEALPPPRPVAEPKAPAATDVVQASAPAPVQDPHARRVWGVAGGEAPGQPTGSGVPPPRHRTFGSRNLTLSRDQHFLDLFGLSLFADDPNTLILGEEPAQDRYFVAAEYLLWWVNPFQVPLLATTGTPASQGFVGRPGTVALLGPGSFGGDSLRSGFRVRAGAWLDGPHGLGVDGSFFTLGQVTDAARFDSSQYPVITRPIFAPNTFVPAGLPGEFGERVTAPGVTTGAFEAAATSTLWGFDANLRHCVCRTCNTRSEWFVGFRNVNLDESLTMTEYIRAVGPASGVTTQNDPVGTVTVVQDRFRAVNQFYGGQVGYAVGRTWDRVSFDGRASAALGGTAQRVEVAGNQVKRVPGQPPQTFANGGLLAAGPNLGTHNNSEVSFVPELTATVGYAVTPRLRATFGYNFLLWTNVARVGDQVDRVVDLTFVPNSQPVNGPAIPPSGLMRPRVPFEQTTLTVQGVQFGLEYRW